MNGSLRVVSAVLTWGGLVVGSILGCAVPAAAQGWIEPPVRAGDEWAVHKVRSDVQVHIRGRVARVEVTEWFRNDGGRLAEGEYLYPLPGEAVFQGFSLFQGDAELRGEIMDRDRARGIYEEIVRRRRDPALIELAGQGLLRARIFPIQPGQERRVSLRYTQVLERAGQAIQLRYQGAVAARVLHRAAPQAEHRDVPRARTSHFRVVVEDGDSFLEPFSPTHTLEVHRSGGQMTVEVPGELTGRLSLFLPLKGGAVGLSLATHRPPGEDGYFMLTLSPGATRVDAEPRDVTVVLDVSGSMSGEKIEQARRALHGILGTLGSSDRFRLVAFSNAVRVQSTEWKRARGRDLEQANRWVDALVADGGTNIGAALDEAFRLESPAERLPVVIFLTDGLPTVGETSPERLADRAEACAGRVRVFAFGVGHDVNTMFLDRLGEAGRGSTEYVEPGENVERAMSLLAAKIQHPVLTDLQIAHAPVTLDEIYPVHIPDVFAGEELVLFGRYRGQGEGRLEVRGSRGGDAASFATDVAFPRQSDANGYIPRLWASRKLGYLTRQIWTEGKTESLVEQIRTLALRYGLPSEYTSYLVQEPEVVLAGHGGVPGRPQTSRMGRPGSPVAAPTTGGVAVKRAAEAKALRDVTSMGKLAAAEALLEERVRQDRDAASTRMVAGRLFRLESGVWKDVAITADKEVLRVKAFSEAYFQILGALPELKPLFGTLSPVVVGGREIALEVGDEGIEKLEQGRLRELVAQFRGPGGAR